MMLQESLKSFRPPVYGKLKRSHTNYQVITDRCAAQIQSLITEYKSTVENQHILRDIRADIDYFLRRCHRYCIEEKIGAHYSEVDLNEEFDFEHLIPASRIRDLLLAGSISINQALNAPTVKLGREKHKLLHETGWASSTPNMWLPFKRYTDVFDGSYQTFDGTVIDTEVWTLNKHFEYFNIK